MIFKSIEQSFKTFEIETLEKNYNRQNGIPGAEYRAIIKKTLSKNDWKIYEMQKEIHFQEVRIGTKEDSVIIDSFFIYNIQ